MTDLISEAQTSPRARMIDGEIIATFDNRYDAQVAVAKMLENDFPKGKIALVSNDVYLIEKVTSRSAYSEQAKTGALIGGSTFSGMAFGTYFSVGSLLPGAPTLMASMLSMAAVGAGLYSIVYVLIQMFSKNRKPISSSEEFKAMSMHIEVPAIMANQARAALADPSS